MSSSSSDIAFTPTIKAIQTARGSRPVYAKMEARGGFRTAIDENLSGFLEGVDTAYLATANAAGQPYAQHRGGPKGFIRVLGPKLIGWAEYAGNRQYISTGNLAENNKAFLIMMDYAQRRRIKLWGHARMSDDPALIAELMPAGYRAQGEQALLFEIEAWDVNCPQHIPQKIDAADMAAALAHRDTRIARLEAELAALKTRLEKRHKPTAAATFQRRHRRRKGFRSFRGAESRVLNCTLPIEDVERLLANPNPLGLDVTGRHAALGGHTLEVQNARLPPARGCCEVMTIPLPNSPRPQHRALPGRTKYRVVLSGWIVCFANGAKQGPGVANAAKCRKGA